MFLNPYRYNAGVYFDPDALSLIARSAIEMSDPEKLAVNKAIKALKFNEIYPYLDTLYISIYGVGSQFSKLDWKRADKQATFVGGNASFSSPYGFLSSLGSYIDTDFNPAADGINVQTNSNTTFAYVTKLPNYTEGPLWHPIWKRAGLTNELKTYSSDYRLSGQANNSNVFTAASIADLSAGELFAIGRSSSTQSELFKGSTVVQTRYTTSTPWTNNNEDNNMRILESDALADVSGGVGVWGMGAYLSSAKLAALKIIIQNYINDLA